MLLHHYLQISIMLMVLCFQCPYSFIDCVSRLLLDGCRANSMTMTNTEYLSEKRMKKNLFEWKLLQKWIAEDEGNRTTHGKDIYTCKHTRITNIFRGIVSQSFHTSTQDGQPRREDEEEEEEAALFLLSVALRRGADGARDWKHRLESDNPGLMASCAGSAVWVCEGLELSCCA